MDLAAAVREVHKVAPGSGGAGWTMCLCGMVKLVFPDDSVACPMCDSEEITEVVHG